MIDKHAVFCNQITRCDRCGEAFGYDGWLRVNSGKWAGKKYHKSCWEKMKEEDNQPKCSSCGVSFKGKPDALYCDKCIEREREREREQN